MFPLASSVKLFQFSLRLLFFKSINFLWLKKISVTLQDCLFPWPFPGLWQLCITACFHLSILKPKPKGSLEPRQSSETLKTNSNYMKLMQSMGNGYKLVTIGCGFTSHFSSLGTGITGKFHSFTLFLDFAHSTEGRWCIETEFEVICFRTKGLLRHSAVAFFALLIWLFKKSWKKCRWQVFVLRFDVFKS